jgi:hypothetical protein
MLVLDTEGRKSHERAADQEGAAARRAAMLDQEIKSNTISVEDDAGRNSGDILAQLGRPLAAQEVIRRLKLCNGRLIFETSIAYPNLIGVYVEKWERNLTGGWDKKKMHVCGMESGIMPEFSVLHKTTKRVANNELFGKEKGTREVPWKEVPTFIDETRGWRTLLLRLLKASLINRHDVEVHFSWTPTYESERWARFTR